MELKQNLEKYKKTNNEQEKLKFRKEALTHLKKKKIYEEYMDKLTQNQIEVIKSDIEKVHEDMVILNKKENNL